MNLQSIKGLDLFGSEIKWRLLTKDTFKSFFGAFITLCLLGLLSLKVFFFVKKVSEYGFVVNQQTNRFKDQFQYINLTNFKLILYSDLDEIIYKYMNKTGNQLIIQNYFNLSNYFDISFENFEVNDQNIVLNPIEINCSSNIDFIFLSKNETIEDMSYYKCLQMDKNSNFLNISKENTYLRKGNGDTTNLQMGVIPQFKIILKMKDLLKKLLNEIQSTFYVYAMFSNFKLNPENYQLEEYFSTVNFPIDLDFELDAEIKFKKLSIIKKIELDIFDYEFYNDDKFMVIDQDFLVYRNFRENMRSRESNKNDYDYIDNFSISFDIFENNNEVTLFTLDDLLSVLGGFMQLIFGGAEIITSIYNDFIGEKLFSKFCWEKFSDYDKTLYHVRRNIETQMKYYELFTNNNEKELNYNINENYKRNKKKKIEIEDSKNNRYFLNNLKSLGDYKTNKFMKEKEDCDSKQTQNSISINYNSSTIINGKNNINDNELNLSCDEENKVFDEYQKNEIKLSSKTVLLDFKENINDNYLIFCKAQNKSISNNFKENFDNNKSHYLSKQSQNFNIINVEEESKEKKYDIFITDKNENLQMVQS